VKRNQQRDESKPAIGFLKFMRSPESEELLCDPLSFALLANIAFRARWRESLNLKGLSRGEALVGDYKRLGLTRRQYRTHLKRLVKWRLITIQPTRKGTIAKLNLEPARVFDIGFAPEPCVINVVRREKRPTLLPMKTRLKRPTGGQQAANRRPVTKKERKKEGKNDTPSENTSLRKNTLFREYTLSGESVCAGGEKEEGLVSGFLINGKFFTSQQSNTLLISNPDNADAIINAAVRAQRHPDGTVTPTSGRSAA
jgi:hypothetical protein